MADVIAAGKDIDCLCTKCKLVLAHTIIAVVNNLPVRVKCNTCHTDRNYRPVKGERAAAAASSSSSSSSSSPAAKKPSSGTGKPRAGAAPVVTAFQIEQKWLDAIGAARRHNAPERPFQLAETFRVGEVVRHSKFGDGVVIAAEPQRMTVFFRDGEKTLGHARPAA